MTWSAGRMAPRRAPVAVVGLVRFEPRSVGWVRHEVLGRGEAVGWVWGVAGPLARVQRARLPLRFRSGGTPLGVRCLAGYDPVPCQCLVSGRRSRRARTVVGRSYLGPPTPEQSREGEPVTGGVRVPSSARRASHRIGRADRRTVGRRVDRGRSRLVRRRARGRFLRTLRCGDGSSTRAVRWRTGSTRTTSSVQCYRARRAAARGRGVRQRPSCGAAAAGRCRRLCCRRR